MDYEEPVICVECGFINRKDEDTRVTYRTKETILEIYAALAEAQRTDQSYASTHRPPTIRVVQAPHLTT